MSLHINSREHLKQRQEVKPLTMEESIIVASYLDECIRIYNHEFANRHNNKENADLVQRFIYEYENLKHFFIISQRKADNMEVQYETVESKMNND